MVTKKQHEEALREAMTGAMAGAYKAIMGLDGSSIDEVVARMRKATGLPAGQLQRVVEMVRGHGFAEAVEDLPEAKALPLAVSVRGAAQTTGLSEGSINQAIRAGQLVAHMPVGRKRIILIDELRSWINYSPVVTYRRYREHPTFR